MRITRKITAISVVGATLLVLGGAIGLAAVIESGEPGNAAHGVKLWAIYCDGCHNARDPKEFRDDQWRVTTTHMKVRAGLPGQDARDILAFLQQANNPTAVGLRQVSATAARAAIAAGPGDSQAGREVYNNVCVACHAEDGTGLVAGVPNFTQPRGRMAKSDEVLLQHIIDGFQSPGSPMAMPPRGGDPDLTDQDLRNSLSFIRRQFEG